MARARAVTTTATPAPATSEHRDVDVEQDVDRSGDRQPQRPPADQPGGDADECGDDGDRQRLPPDGGRRLTGTHAEGTEHAEIASPPAHGEHQGVGDGDEPEAEHGDADGGGHLLAGRRAS